MPPHERDPKTMQMYRTKHIYSEGSITDRKVVVSMLIAVEILNDHFMLNYHRSF